MFTSGYLYLNFYGIRAFYLAVSPIIKEKILEED